VSAIFCYLNQTKEGRTMRSISSVVIPGLMAACALSRMVRAMWHALRVPSICFAVLMGTALPHARQSQSLDHSTGTPMQPGWLHKLNMEVVHGSTEQVHHNGSGRLLPGIIIMILRVCGQEVKLVNNFTYACWRCNCTGQGGSDTGLKGMGTSCGAHPCSAVCFPSR